MIHLWLPTNARKRKKFDVNGVKKEFKGKFYATVLIHMWYGLSGVFRYEPPECGPIYEDTEKGLDECFIQQS